MAQLLSTYLGVNPKEFKRKRVFDAVIGVDTRLFLDPFLLKKTDIPEFCNSRKKIEKYYSDIIRLLLVYRRTQNSRAWRQALHRLTFRETKGVFIGYGVHGGDGNAIGGELAKRLLATALEILDMGIEDPEIFELIGLFEEDFGADRLSDMTIAVIKEDIFAYTERLAREFKIPRDRTISYELGEREYLIPKHPFRERPLVFLPETLLRDLPVALDREGIDHVVSTNQALRDRLNKLIGATWKKKIKKRELRDFILERKENVEELVLAYKKSEGKPYDFVRDPAGEVKWYEIGHSFANQNRLLLKRPERKIGDLEDIVEQIVKQFKKLIEAGGLNIHLYSNSKPLHERFAQRLFFAVADTYCKANNIDVNPEPNAGNGPVDFKFSSGYYVRVLAEIKLTSSKRILHGFTKQLPAYQASEGAQRSFYVVLQTSKSDEQVKQLRELQAKLLREGNRIPHVVIIDATLKPSASKR